MVHYIWAACCTHSAEPLKTTPLAHFPVTNHIAVAVILYAVATLALLPLLFKRLDNTMFSHSGWRRFLSWGLIFTAPQQIFLMIPAGTSIYAVIQGKYPDGTIRAWDFILPDQSWEIVSMFAHSFAVWDWYIKAPYVEVK